MPACPETLTPPPLALIVSHLFSSVTKTPLPVWGQVSPGRVYGLGLHADGPGGTPAPGGRELHSLGIAPLPLPMDNT